MYGNAKATAGTARHLAPTGGKNARQYYENGESSEVHVFSSIYEEQKMHPPITDIEIKKRNFAIWHRVREQRRLPHLDNYCKASSLKEILESFLIIHN